MSAPILVMGATSGIGAAVVDAAVARGLPVRAFARSAEDLAPRDFVEPFAGDALSETDVASALSGTWAVVYALGVKESVSMLWEEVTLFSHTTEVLIKAMKASQTKRLLAVTGFGAGRSKSAMSRVEQLGHRALLGKPYADKDRQEALIMKSGLDWTIVRPPSLTGGPPTGTFRHGELLQEPGLKYRISRADVAEFMLRQLETDAYVGKLPCVSN